MLLTRQIMGISTSSRNLPPTKTVGIEGRPLVSWCKMESVSVSLSYPDLRFHVVNGVGACDFQSNGLSGKSFDEDLHLET